jgi:hypothetical protein
MDINNIIASKGRIYYWQFLNKSECTQYHLGTDINDITRYNQSDKNRYNESVRVYLKYKHLINDETQTNITQNMLACLLESIYIIKFNIFKIDIYDELELLRNKKITKRCLKTEKAKINKKLNKIIPNLKSNMIAIEKKRFLINIEPANLPHDLENLIFTYLY